MRNVYSIFFIGFFYLIFAILSQVQAQAPLKSSTGKQIAFAFYKTAQATPNFTRWVENVEPYISTPMAKRKEVRDRELSVLRSEFDRYNPQTDLLTIKTKVSAAISIPKDPQTGEPSETAEFRYDYKNARGNADKIFTFSFGGDNFAVIVEELEKMRVMPFPAKQVNYYRQAMRSSQNSGLSAVLQLRPISADTTNPYDVNDKTPHWLMMAEIASISFWNGQGQLVHQYTAPWYFSPVNREIEALKNQKMTTDTVVEETPSSPSLSGQ